MHTVAAVLYFHEKKNQRKETHNTMCREREKNGTEQFCGAFMRTVSGRFN